VGIAAVSGFSPAWLALREPADNIARNRAVLDACAQHFSAVNTIKVCDLGAGTGSTLRVVADLLPAEQDWTLVDSDRGNLTAAYDALSAWADSAAREGEALNLSRRGKSMRVRTCVRDFAREPTCWPEDTDLVTASALFDLTSEAWLARFVGSLSARRTPLLAALTFDGLINGAPSHALDARLAAAFNRHQRSDKGFGPAAGPDAARILEEELAKAGYTLTTGDSPWMLAPSQLQSATAQGIADAAVETGAITRAEAEAWRIHPRSRLVIGHRDVFAV
jgi:hypothetical protein